ncbi:MAG TPA: phage protease [Phycisphaerae bacterium]|nr:phage protease [Phycisphaerae bacterium]HOJ75296.1 phage protease [Phycisphaerae bacterium]HOM53039.1 phage protease [Phycisphaerae bacterium]HOQ87368.1 phage protease [Phycisphaerae bacterium]HPP28202.1 phage protease [Phycisphaerae bacterium]
MSEHGSERVVAASSAIVAGAAGRVLIAPWGQVRSANGDFVLDAEAGRMVLEAFEAHGTDVPVDYEHQSLGGTYAAPSGLAPAAGWIKALHVVEPQDDAADGGSLEPGLYADVEWTEAARAKLEAREYRYLSPVVIVRKRDRRVVALHSAALTNKPAIVGMRPIVNKTSDERTEERMHEQTVTNAAEPEGLDKRPPQAVDDAVEALRLRLGLDSSSDGETVILAAERRLTELMTEASRREAEERVTAATRAGKLIPVQREWAMALALRDPTGFDEWAATAPVVVSLGRTQPPEAAEPSRQRATIVASARAAFRAEPGLALITDEEAWVRTALRDAGLKEED